MGKAEAIIEKATSRRHVIFEGTCDYLPLLSDDYERDEKTGKVIKRIPGLALRFINGYTRAYDMEHEGDRAEVEQIRDYLKKEEGRDDRLFRFGVKESSPEGARRPFNNFDKLGAKKIVELVEALMPDAEGEQVPFIENAIAYEAQNKNRKTVIEALADLLDDGVGDDDLVEVEVGI